MFVLHCTASAHDPLVFFELHRCRQTPDNPCALDAYGQRLQSHWRAYAPLWRHRPHGHRASSGRGKSMIILPRVGLPHGPRLTASHAPMFSPVNLTPTAGPPETPSAATWNGVWCNKTQEVAKGAAGCPSSMLRSDSSGRPSADQNRALTGQAVTRSFSSRARCGAHPNVCAWHASAMTSAGSSRSWRRNARK